MPRNMAFSHTEQQIIDQSKTVTRRIGWNFLRPGEQLWAVRKSMGLKPGERVVRLALIRVVSVRRERLNQITDEDVVAEGFPGMSRLDFIRMFIANMRPTYGAIQPVNRIEFEYLSQKNVTGRVAD